MLKLEVFRAIYHPGAWAKTHKNWPDLISVSISAYNFGDKGVQQEKLAPFITELNIHLVQEPETLKKDPRKGGAAACLAPASHLFNETTEKQQCARVPWQPCTNLPYMEIIWLLLHFHHQILCKMSINAHSNRKHT